MHCENYKVCAWRYDDGHRVLFTRLRCKQWSCPVCADKNRQVWQEFLSGMLPIVSDTWYLVTLTAHSRLRSAQRSLENIRKNIDRLVKRIRRVFGKVEYVRVYEPHPSSKAIHAHLVCSGLTDYVAIGANSKHVPCAVGVVSRDIRAGFHSVGTWLKDTAQALTMGYQADVRKVDNPARAVRYVVKYLTKAQSLIAVKHLRHVQTTRRIGSPGTETTEDWTVAQVMREGDLNVGDSIIDLNTGEVIPYSYWREFQLYPLREL